MSFGGRKYKKKDAALIQSQEAAIAAIAGISEAAFLAAAADGEVNEDELELVAQIISDLCGGVDGVVEVITACAEAFDEDGFEARMDGIAELLPTDGARLVALYAVSAVILGDDEYDADSEGEFYDDFAETIGCSEEVAAEVWNSQLENYGWL
ncbi:MAG: hypothetical protein NT062_12405 [Proteobacteria bacterium]|nr:hypothetical protein [Pseudomonadota bacterium]